jgi:hypothetical protein
LLVKYNVLAKEHASNVEKLFAANTGGNLHNYDSYLGRESAATNDNPWLDKKGSAKK